MIQFNRPSAALLATGFAEHVAQWARDHADLTVDNEVMLRELARHLSIATSDGHVCARLQDIVANHSTWSVAELRAVLLKSGVAGTPAHPGAFPLILDDANQLYLHRYFDYERRLARRLMQPRPVIETPNSVVKHRLNSLFAANEAAHVGRPDWQKLGAGLSLLSPLTIISGGPGTGKTTTVVNLLACLLEQNPDCRIALAAPTGKAAARMLDALRARAVHLPAELQKKLPTESTTVHRLLGTTSTNGVFQHDADNPLSLDVLIVDEASMLDLALATQLFEAVPTSARIILLGDKDQLSAVESGAVFAELSADPTLDVHHIAALAELCNTPLEDIHPSPALHPTSLHNSVVWFTENFRFHKESGIGRLAADINAGDADKALRFLREGDDAAVQWTTSHADDIDIDALQLAFDGYAAYIEAIRQLTAPSIDIFTVFNHFRVLCALRDTARGTDTLNRLISRHVRAQLQHATTDDRSPWYTGRPVMVLRNDTPTRLFNGDIGITVVDTEGKPMVWFVDQQRGVRGIAPARLPEHETAFAMTVHKSQGSEFEQVMLVLPTQFNRVLTRELLYTAVTRARQQVVITGNAEVFAEAIRHPTIRYSGLIARLAE
jgi:exodeoxyribonuclease V alpha subunit